MALVYGRTVTDFFFGLLNNTFSVAVPFGYASTSLPQPIIAASGGLLAYDNTAKQLRFSGVLTTAAEHQIAALATVATTDTTDNLAAGLVNLTPVSMANIVAGTVLVIDSGAAQEALVVVSVTATTFTTTTSQAHNGTATPFAIKNDPNLPGQLAALAAASQQAVAPFFDTYPELWPLYNDYVASTDPSPTRRETLLSNFLPTLKRVRKSEQRAGRDHRLDRLRSQFRESPIAGSHGAACRRRPDGGRADRSHGDRSRRPVRPVLPGQ